MIIHYAQCSPNYPEKLKTEPPQLIETFDIGFGETLHQCVDCGAFEIIKKEPIK